MKQLTSDFFRRDTLKVAKDLVGKILRVGNINARILEVEAYKQDKASHARTRTKRSEIMFATHGHVYVYFVYGMYYCLNITTDESAGAVLIRAVDYPGCTGPGKLCKVLGINKTNNGEPLGKNVKIFSDDFNAKVKASPRIGIKEDIHLKWRFNMVHLKQRNI